jgi:hypothetical protein
MFEDVYNVNGTLILDPFGNSNAARRAVVCVNACAGMDNPAAEIARLRTMLEDVCSIASAWFMCKSVKDRGGKEKIDADCQLVADAIEYCNKFYNHLPDVGKEVGR